MPVSSQKMTVDHRICSCNDFSRCRRCRSRRNHERKGSRLSVKRVCAYPPCTEVLIVQGAVAEKFDRSFCCPEHFRLTRFGAVTKPCSYCSKPVTRTGKLANAEKFFCSRETCYVPWARANRGFAERDPV